MSAGVKRKRETSEANIEGGEEAPEKRRDGTGEAKKRFSVEQAAGVSEESMETDGEKELKETLRRVYDEFKLPEAQMSTPKRNPPKPINTPTRKKQQRPIWKRNIIRSSQNAKVYNKQKKTSWKPRRNTT